MLIAGVAGAQTVSSDQAAGLIVFPRVVSDPGDIFGTGTATDTVLQLTNTDADDAHVVHCFILNATGICSTGQNVPDSDGAECRSAADCVGFRPTCDPRWTVGNFSIVLSPNQTVGWVASAGGTVGTPPGDGSPAPVTTEYFEGELKCIEVDGTSVTGMDASGIFPIAANDLQGNATIYRYSEGTSLDVASYNAVGIQSIAEDDSVDDDRTLCLGGNGLSGDACEDAEYAACPSRLILDHWFEGATYQEGETASTSVTFAPCTQRFDTTEVQTTVVQLLVYNEFEQRLSASIQVECVTTIELADISNLYSISVHGTLTGQTHFRPVSSGVEGLGSGLIAVAEESISGRNGPVTNAFALHHTGMLEDVADVVSYVIP